MPDLCRISAGPVNAMNTPPSDPLLDRVRATWTAGDFGRIAMGYAPGAAAFVRRLALKPAHAVLDVACGTGNLTLPAARDHAIVTGLDLAPNLIAEARESAVREGLDIRFDVGAAEALPYGDGAFDAVMSMFGVMFSPRPELALAELMRVTRDGGRIALASWTPAGFIGGMLRAHTALVPPPAEMPSPLAWGDEAAMRARLAVHADRIREVQFEPRMIALAFPLTAGGVVELFREFYGPTVKTFAALDAQGRANLTAALLRMWTEENSAPAGGTSVAAEYLDVQIQLR
jgi:SAM-dependent methyltransferase